MSLSRATTQTRRGTQPKANDVDANSALILPVQGLFGQPGDSPRSYRLNTPTTSPMRTRR